MKMFSREQEFEKLEQALLTAGKTIVYPATPALASRVRNALPTRSMPRPSVWPRLAWTALAAVVIAAALLLAFPETREAVAQFLGLRTVRIIPVTPTTTPTSATTPGPTASVAATPLATRPLPLAEQCCETTLADARSKSSFPILLPPAEQPSRVFLQDLPLFGPGAQQLILVFGDPANPRAILFQATDFLYGKLVTGGTVIEETQVKSQRALWLTGAPHVLIYTDSLGRRQFQTERAVTRNTLAWEIGSVTFRLETDLSKDEAVRFAESLR